MAAKRDLGQRLAESHVQAVQVIKTRAIETARKLEKELGCPPLWIIEGWLLGAQALVSEHNSQEIRDYANGR